MGHGGKRAGAGRKHKTGPTSRYRIVKKGWEWRHAVGRHTVAIGQRCEVLSRLGHTRRYHIIWLVAGLYGVRYTEVKRCWDDYRALEADLKKHPHKS